MAEHDITYVTEQYNVDAEKLVEKVCAMSKWINPVYIENGRLIAKSRGDEQAAIYWAQRIATPAAPAKTAARPDRATERQVSYIMSLISQGAHEEGGFIAGPTTRAEIAKLTKAEASAYITSLKGNY